MKLKKFVKGQGLKYLLVVLAALSIILGISGQILLNLQSKHWNSTLRKEDELFLQIANRLEFYSLDDEAKRLIGEYADLYKGNANVIITDEDGKVIYHLNDGYMPEKNYFSVSYNKNSSIAYITDNEKNAKYKAIIDHSYSGYGRSYLYEFQRNLELFSERLESFSLSRDTGPAPDDTEHATNYTLVYMDGSFVGSKGYFLYSVSGKQLTDLVLRDPSYRGYSKAAIIIIPICAGTFLLFWLLLPIWVFIDALKRGFRAALWTILTLLTNLVGLIVYLVVRPEYIRCKNCGEQLSNRFVNCPYCGEKNKEACSKCNRILEENWRVCPDCGHPKEQETIDNTI